MKKLLALLLAVLMLATMFTGCSQNKKSEDSSSTASTETKAEEKKEEPKKEEPKKEEPKKEEPKKEEPKKKEEKKEEAAPSTKVDEYSLRMSWWGSQVRHDGTIKAIEMYMDKNPNVKIEYEYSGWDGYWDKIAAQAAANELPNIWQQSIAYVKMYADADQILDLQPYVNEGYIDLNDWSQGAVDTTRIDGKLFSLTLGNSAHTILYDPDIFKEAGVDLPDFDWTWDDYKATVKAINENLGIYGDCTFPNMNAKDGLRHYVFSQGYTMYNEDQNALNFPKELMVEYLNWELELQKAGYIADQATQGEITTVEASLLVTGEAAMNSSMNSNMCVATMEAAGKPMAMVCYPH
ncbi:MAG: extracellular solute-binding protein [Clostridiales bacterium]|nr:extracellular solute-binding protein [Clostridiales bacterium]